ncbi:MAG TPA: AbrB/MazE/SpoVT family DNA-binding domain-containing protein [Candidatus Binatia bacterium]|nr:AbrB/MazE/SpoVT family DNA-binding domain-containing protein [Candidatus Binatia bacterium]
MKIKITTVGNSAGVVLPKGLLVRLRLRKGDFLFATETADGVHLAVHDRGFERQMRVAEAVLRQEREALQRLDAR